MLKDIYSTLVNVFACECVVFIFICLFISILSLITKSFFYQTFKNMLHHTQMRKQSHEAILETTAEMGLSRKSALNDRYFEKEKQRSRSLDNLLQSEVVPSPVKLANLGLSSSKLNERYHSLERIGETPAVSNVEYMTRTEITQERKYSRATRTTEPNIEEEDLTIDFEYPDIQSVSQTGRSEDDKSYIRSQTRFIKSQYPGM